MGVVVMSFVGIFFFFFRMVVMVIVVLWIGDIWILFPFHRWIVVAVDRGSQLRFDPVLDHGLWLDRC